MEKQRITIRLPVTSIRSIDLFVRAGEFSTRSEVIRHAVNNFIKSFTDKVIEKTDQIKKVQELELAVEVMEPCTKK
jgi:Arc/MetJ-type ribon-helix-helix transcriptional regulator